MNSDTVSCEKSVCTMLLLAQAVGVCYNKYILKEILPMPISAQFQRKNTRVYKEDDKINMKRQYTLLIILCAGLLLCSACGRAASNSRPTETAQKDKQDVLQQEDGKQKSKKEICLVVKHDAYNYQITLMNLADASTICYEYTEGTEFFDKYGDYTLSEEFQPGKLVTIKRLNSNETLGALAFTDQTWDYEKVSNYSIDTDKGRIVLADKNYRYASTMKVFSEGEETELYAIRDGDILDVYGIDRTIYSIVIREGHGTLALTNTDLFEGGWMNLGTKVYTTVLKDMKMDIPEGVYEFAVANDGYGDSGEIRIRRGMTTTIDLNDYKGEGPKMCKMKFKVGVEDAVLIVDNEKVDVKKPLEVRYGIHTLSVYAAGYDLWSKQLVVNSPKATIDIRLSDVDEGAQTEEKDSGSENEDKAQSSQDSDSSTSTNAGSKAGTMAGSYAGSNQSSAGTTDKDSSSALANAALGSSLASIITGGKSTDYLDTLSNLVDSLDRLNKSKSNTADNGSASDE